LPVGHPAELRLTHVAVGNVEVAASYAAELASLGSGIDFAQLGIVANLTVQAADGRGVPRPDWAIEILYQEAAVAKANATLTATLPRTTLLGGPYLVKITTTAKTPTGEPFTAAKPLNLTQDTTIQVQIPTTKLTVVAIDGFGKRRDWPVEVVNVATGIGTTTAEVVEGAKYTAKTAGLGFVNVTEFVARGPEMVVAVKIPTGWVAARVVDGFGQPRDWPVEVVGVAAGRGVVSVEVLPRPLHCESHSLRQRIHADSGGEAKPKPDRHNTSAHCRVEHRRIRRRQEANRQIRHCCGYNRAGGCGALDAAQGA